MGETRYGGNIMAQINQKINIETTNKILTSYAGMVPFANAIRNSNFIEKIQRLYFSKKVRQKGYSVGEKISSLLTLILSGGEHLSDIQQLEHDEGFKTIMAIERFPVKSVLSNFLNSMRPVDTQNYYFLNIEEAINYYKRNQITQITLDIDSVLSENNKKVSNWSYKKFKAFNPMFIVDEKNKIMIAGIFRNGNASPQTNILEIFKDAYQYLKELDFIEKTTVRIDSAGYQKDIIDYFNTINIQYTITGDSSAGKIALFKAIPDEEWEKYDDIYDIAKTNDFISSDGKETPIKVIVKRRIKKEPDLFGIYEYYYIVHNLYGEKINTVVKFHAHRANAENMFKELKADFWLDNFPCNTLEGNAFFMQIMISAYNLFQMLKERLFENSWLQFTLRTVQYKMIHLAGLIVRGGRKVTLKVNSNYIYLKEFIAAVDTSQYTLL